MVPARINPMVRLSAQVRSRARCLLHSAFPQSWRVAASLAAAYCTSALSYLAVSFILTRSWLDPIFQSLAALIDPDLVWGIPRARFRSYVIPFFDIDLDVAQLVILTIMLSSLLFFVHLMVFAIVDLSYRWRGRPEYWSEFHRQREIRRRISVDTLSQSAWQSAFAFPLAGGLWAIWHGVSQASIMTNPGLLMPASPAFASNCLAVVLIYFFVTSAILRQRVLREVVATGPRCVDCGYVLRYLKSPRCPECGSAVSANSQPAFEIRGLVVLRLSPSWPIHRWLMVGLLLLIPLLVPIAGGVLMKLIRLGLPSVFG